jgi:2-keto-4-pentenoate hydratase/2-oxohepta-3-ene-1,7-dioic acid hydratase in catechol pathway
VFFRLTGKHVRVKKLLNPIKNVPVIYCIGLNYPDHAHNVQNGSLPPSPIVFFKNRNAASGPTDDVIVPALSTNPDYEAEMGLVISKV